jgi:hypothetical protein
MVMVIANPSYPTFCLPGDPSSISVYENNGQNDAFNHWVLADLYDG